MKKINFKKYFSAKNAIFISLLLVTIFLLGNSVLAADWVNNAIGGIIGVLINGVTKILILLVNVLIVVASYSDFIHAEAVTKGWVVVRDICNMFFVVVLLVIAFATILGQEEFSAKKNLPKLIMAAVLINFSKMFCGIMIDIANVVMLTFVNAFKEIGSANMIDMLGISDVLRYGQGGEPPSLASTVTAYIFGLIYVLIATVVVASMLAMLVMRIVMMWIYIVLSPAAFFLQAVPGKGQQYASQWWSKWTSNLIVGPVLAFFLWLSFAALQSGSSPLAVSDATDQQALGEGASYVMTESSAAQDESIDSKAGSVSGFAKFAIAIGMLLGGMKIAQEVGGETGSVLGKGMNAINKGKTLVTGAAIGAAKGIGKSAGRGVRNASLTVAGGLMNAGSGRDATGKQKGRAGGNLALQWRDDMIKNRKKEKTASREKFLKKIGISEDAAAVGKDVIKDKYVQYTGNLSGGALKGMAIGGTLGSVVPVVGTTAGAIIGGAMGAVRGFAGQKRLQETKKKISDYEAGPQKADDAEINTYNAAVAADPKAVATESQKKAIKGKRAYQNRKALVEGGKESFGSSVVTSLLSDGKSLDVTNSAFKSMTSKQKKAEERVKVMGNNPNYFSGLSKNSIYRNDGINDDQKRWLDIVNKGGVGSDGEKVVENTVKQLNGTVGSDQLKDSEAVELAKLIAAYKKDDKNSINPATLGQIEAALRARTGAVDTNPDTYSGQVLTNYKELTPKMKVEAGSGNLQYDAFAKNSAKAPADRKSEKDIMGVSFDKFNAKAKSMGADELNEAAGVNQKVDGTRLKKLSGVMSALIDDEIKALETVGGEASAQKISQLGKAKERLAQGDISGLSLKNTDVKYDGDTDSERRRNEYNTVQHETMHQAGAVDEELVNDSSNTLQQAKLTGNIPGSSGQRYDQEIGKLIASMEKTSVSQDDIRTAVASQIEKWQVPNAQRVVEIENNQRETVKDVLLEPEEKVVTAEAATSPDNSRNMENFEKAIDKMTTSLNKSFKPVSGKPGAEFKLSVVDKDFLRKLSIKSDKINENVANKLKPLGAMAANEEKRRNP